MNKNCETKCEGETSEIIEDCAFVFSKNECGIYAENSVINISETSTESGFYPIDVKLT